MNTFTRKNIKGEVELCMDIKAIPAYLEEHPDDKDEKLMRTVYDIEMERENQRKGR